MGPKLYDVRSQVIAVGSSPGLYTEKPVTNHVHPGMADSM
jgi:hypothetical protein